MNTVITRLPADSLASCQLTHIERDRIDPKLAGIQHRSLCRIISQSGYDVITLPAIEDLPDSTFLEDTAFVLPGRAVLLPMGTDSRKDEPYAIEASLNELLPLSRIEHPARIEGGDILRIGKKIFVGLSTRTNRRGFEALRAIAEPMGFEMCPVEVSGSLHLKTAVCALDDQTVLINSEWVDKESFDGLNQIQIDEREPFAANVLRLGNCLIAHSGFEKTIEKVRSEGFELIEVDISEFLKAEAGLTCLCLAIDDGLTPRKPQDT